MTATNGDGIDEDLTRAVGMAMIAASRAGEKMARMRQSAARERQARAEGDTVRAQREIAAQTEAARAYFEVVTRPEYLTAATDEQVREVARQAQAWRKRLPEAQDAADAATGELGARAPVLEGRSAQAAVLAGQAEAADRQPSGAHEPGRGAAATAAIAQARPASEAPSASTNADPQGAARRGVHELAVRGPQLDVKR